MHRRPAPEPGAEHAHERGQAPGQGDPAVVRGLVRVCQEAIWVRLTRPRASSTKAPPRRVSFLRRFAQGA